MITVRTAQEGAPSAAARHTAAAEQFAAEGRWELAYQHLRDAVRILHGLPSTDELDRLRREHAEAREQSRRDSLTATYNRRYLDERLAALLDDPACLTGLSVALVDVDHFKQINDTYGHLVGDRVLQQLVMGLSVGLPEGAFCARYGGEEFAIVMPGRGLQEAVTICEAARNRIAGHRWVDLPQKLRVTVSAGVAQMPGPISDAHRLVGRADALLYAAKHSGRNAVAFRDELTGSVRLAGAAAARRGILQSQRLPTPPCDRNATAP